MAPLLKTVLKLYADEAPISPENALYASAKVGGHPYSLYCLSVSEAESKQFDSQEAIDNLIRYEIEQGKIYGFWQTHFEQNRVYINADNDEELGKKIIYLFTKYYDEPVNITEIAKTLHVSKKAVEAKLEKLYLADLVYRSAARFYTLQ